MKLIKPFLVASLLAWSAGFAFAQKDLTYQTPPKEIVELVDAPLTPSVRFNKQGTTMLILHRSDFLPISVVAQPVLGLAGLRINPAVNGSAVTTSYTAIGVKTLDGPEKPLTGLPREAQISDITWSPNDSSIAFTNQTDNAIELWIADLVTLTAKKLGQGRLNGTYGRTIQWTPDGKAILALYIPDNRQDLKKEIQIPKGPVIQENLGKTAPSRTYQNLLKNTHDETLFDFYATSQIKRVDLQGKATAIGEPGIFRNIAYSPDGKYLLIESVVRPYSYLVPVYAFPYNVAIWDTNGHVLKDVYQAPLAENTPIGFDAVVKGPRNFSWRADQPATLFWVEALDEGDPRKQVPFRDALYLRQVPFNREPQKLFETKERYRRIYWGNNKTAIVTERWWKSRHESMTLINPAEKKKIKVISDRSYEDAYADPGNFVLTDNTFNRRVLLLGNGNHETVFTIGTGASPLGDRPFLLKWDLDTLQADTLFKSLAPFYEMPVYFNNKGYCLLSRESIEQAPNYFRLDLKHKTSKQVTAFPDPYPSLKGITKEQVSYRRSDGIKLTATLYLPKGYDKKDGPLPVFMWAYPREFRSKKAAAQVKGSPYRFTRLSWGSPIYWVTQGYAILDNAAMPIIGVGSTHPNDAFVEQVQSNAKAAIDYLSSRGVGDPKRVGVGGHSYGAFMTANLVAHTNLFAAGIARSGAYNRTLTPFGFQSEERTYWQAPEVYYKMSPFSYADKIKTPLLLIHGIDDENSGTFPIQSERMYNALKGHGAVTRLVMLPHEFHHYRAKESVFHMLWEMNRWLETYVKDKK